MTTRQQFHPQVNRRFARKDGLTPADFQFEQWEVSNVHLRHIAADEHYPDDIALVYRCDMPADTPHPNQYIEEKDRQPGVVYEDAGAPGWLKIPDPVGIALSRVKFQLLDADTYDVLDEDNRDHTDGVVTGLLGASSELWDRLTPGTSLDVRLIAFPLFFYLTADGAAHMEYANLNNGYFSGREDESRAYTLSLTENGGLLIDDESAPVAEAIQESESLPDTMLGYYLKQARETSGLSQLDVGKQVAPTPFEGYDDDQSKSDWVNLVEMQYTDRAWPDEAQCRKLAEILDLDADTLIAMAARDK